jgi:hypothetical protein
MRVYFIRLLRNIYEYCVAYKLTLQQAKIAN